MEKASHMQGETKHNDVHYDVGSGARFTAHLQQSDVHVDASITKPLLGCHGVELLAGNAHMRTFM